MPNFQLQDTQKVPYVISEVDADGNPTTEAGDVCTVSSSDVTMATVVPDAAPVVAGAQQTGFILGGKTLGTVTITSHIVKADGTTLPDATDAIDIIAGAPAAQSIGLGTPVAQ